MPGPLSRAVARLIAAAADELLVSQTELGRRIGVSQAQVSRVFAGDRAFTLDQIDAACDLLGLSIVALIHEAKTDAGRDRQDESTVK